MTSDSKNRSQDSAKNRPQDGKRNRPDIINPVALVGVVDGRVLEALLRANKQSQWCTPVRIKGLLLLLDYICRHMTHRGISISADLARSFVSKLRKKIDPRDITEPLLLLRGVGILKLLRPAVFAHIKTSAFYDFWDPYK